MASACERTEAKKLITSIPAGNILLFDKGYPSFEFILYLLINYAGYFVFRCPAKSTLPAIEDFANSKKREGIIWLKPSVSYMRSVGKKKCDKLEPLKIRAIKMISPDGEVSVLLTNLYSKRDYSAKDITTLYFKRWEVETYYGDEKKHLEMEKFHSKTVNGVLQEIYAVAIMAVISRLLMAQSSMATGGRRVIPQFKNAMLTLASDAAVLTPETPERAAQIFEEVLTEISRVIYYRPKTPRPSVPRVSKKPINKWTLRKRLKTAGA